jgi:hypothetical protein
LEYLGAATICHRCSIRCEWRPHSKARMPSVFISYSHDSPAHRDSILALSDRLRAEGVDCRIAQYEESPPEGWPQWCDRQVEKSDFVLVVCTEIYLRRFQRRGRRWGRTTRTSPSASITWGHFIMIKQVRRGRVALQTVARDPGEGAGVGPSHHDLGACQFRSKPQFYVVPMP